MSDAESNVIALLLDIKEQQGAMGAQLIEAARGRARLEDGLAAVNDKIAKIEPVVETVAVIKPKVEELLKMRDRLAAIAVVMSFVITSAIGLIYTGVKQFGPEIKSLFRGHV